MFIVYIKSASVFCLLNLGHFSTKKEIIRDGVNLGNALEFEMLFGLFYTAADLVITEGTIFKRRFSSISSFELIDGSVSD